MIFELHDIEFSGSASIEDPSSKITEQMHFTAPISTCQILLSLGEEYAAWGSLYPRFNIDSVAFSIQEELIVVSAFGDLPLYKSHEFERVVKRWLIT